MKNIYSCTECGHSIEEAHLGDCLGKFIVTTVEPETGQVISERLVEESASIGDLLFRRCDGCNKIVKYNSKKDWRSDKMEIDIPIYTNGDEIKELEKAGDVVATIMDAGTYVEFEDKETHEKKKVLNVKIELANKEGRIWSPNTKSQQALARSFGKETTAWVGKKVKFETARVNVFGNMKNIIYATPLK